jgi:hypothetical protein
MIYRDSSGKQEKRIAARLANYADCDYVLVLTLPGSLNIERSNDA